MNSEEKVEEFLQTIEKNKLGMEDTFKFGCKQCGACCRKRSAPIAITSVDLYNIAKATGLHPMDALIEFTECLPGPESKLPVLYLKERMDGSCKLLRNGKCSVQQDKPVVCRVFPLGRLSDGKTFTYFTQGACEGEGREIRLKDWLEEFNLPALDEACILWAKLLVGAGTYMMKLKGKPQKMADFYSECLLAFYFLLDTEKSIEDNLTEAIEYLKEKYPKFHVE